MRIFFKFKEQVKSLHLTPSSRFSEPLVAEVLDLFSYDDEAFDDDAEVHLLHNGQHIALTDTIEKLQLEKDATIAVRIMPPTSIIDAT